MVQDQLPLRPYPDEPAGAFAVDLGLVATAFAIIQIDINPVHRTLGGAVTEVTMCDHNCTVQVDGTATGGRYTCPAAMSLNPGVGARDVAPTALLVDGLLRTIEGIRLAQDRFLAADLPGYLDDEGVPDDVRRDITAALNSTNQVVNLFGGSPDLHPGCLDIVRALHRNGVQVHLTTTGRRIVREPRFRAAFVADPPDLLALSLDDIDSVADLETLFALDDAQLATAWRATPAVYGQRRKAIEAVQIVRLAQTEAFPGLLFNIVIHPRNLLQLPAFLDAVTHHAPDALLNPYPVQSAFLGESSQFGATDLDHLASFSDLMIDAHLDRRRGVRPRWNITPRLTYWLLLRSLAASGEPDAARADRIGGAGVWRCYGRRGAGRCVQIGAARASRPPTGDRTTPSSMTDRSAQSGAVRDAPPVAGGYPGCFWNGRTVTDDRQFWAMTGDELAGWILDRRQQLAAAAPQPCMGCLFPRMTLDGVGLELGLVPDVAAGYRAERAKILGY